MRYKRLGHIEIPAIGQGCFGIGGYFSRDSSRDDSYIKALRLGVYLGMNFIDNAEIYGDGHSEEIVGRAVKGIRDKVIIATKFSPEHNSYKDVLKAAEGSLRRLDTDYIDLYQMHWPNPNIPLEDTLSAMAKLVEDGKVRYIGLCNVYVQRLKAAQSILTDVKIASLQTEYNLFNQMAKEEVAPFCEQNKIIIIAYSPLDRGRMEFTKEQKEVMDALAERYNKTIAQITLRWLIGKSCIVAIPKATSIKHVKENASSADFDFEQNDIGKIDAVFKRAYVYVPTDKIRVPVKIGGNRIIYQTMKEARQNRMRFVPSPSDLARTIAKEEVIKPVRLVYIADRNEKCEYDLVEGGLRYWAWVIAHDGKVPIRAFVQ